MSEFSEFRVTTVAGSGLIFQRRLWIEVPVTYRGDAAVPASWAPWARGHRGLLMACFDAAAWTFALLVFTQLRLDVVDQPVDWRDIIVVGLVAGLTQIGLGWVVRLHQGRAPVGSLEEMILVGSVTGTTGLVTIVVNTLASPHLLPRSVPVAATFLTLVLMAWARAVWRRLRERTDERLVPSTGVPALIVGAGEAGRQLVASMRSDLGGAWKPVGLLDDDPRKRHLRIRGVPVVGTSHELAEAALTTGASTLIVAVPSASAAVVRRLNRQASSCNLDVKVLPPIAELFDRRVGISDIRDVEAADLLGRHQIKTDVGSIAGYLTGRRVLVTGAGGSIGSELCRQINHFRPAELIMLDRDESALHAVQLSIEGRALLDSPDVVLADIRDTQSILELFERRQPHVVFHAAALKHLPMLEQYPGEAVKTNVWGTLSVLDAAAAVGVERFVNISTDKAANPCNVLGYSKRIAEGMTAATAQRAAGTYLSVRFGNVLGSRGSVLKSFAAQIASGGPLTVTDPEVTRYFMTIREAVELVIQAAAIGRDGEALVLDMGSPVRIADVAHQLIELSGRDMPVVYTGLRGGEKMHEDLFGDGEPDERPVHPLVSHVRVPPADAAAVLGIDAWATPGRVAANLAAVCESMAARGVEWAVS
jgi:FlaA1/EpsC-like NDP-sugar epimerase